MGAAPWTTEPEGTPVDQLPNGPGVTVIDPNDPAAVQYRMVDAIRGASSLREMMIQPVRAGYLGANRRIDPALLPPTGAALFPTVAVQQIYIPTTAGPVRAQVYRTPDTPTPAPVILYAHGGGFMVGQSEDVDFLTRKLSFQNNVIVVSINYRLAPEWPFPSGLDDTLAVYAWLLEQAGSLGGDPRRIAIAGDSSGSNFAAVAPLRLASQGLPAPAAVIMLGPVVDFRFEDYASFNREAPLGTIYDAAFVGFLRGAYVRHDQWDHPHVSPLRAGAALANYPPAMLVVGTEDPIIDSASAFAGALLDAGNAFVELFVRDGMPHGFYFFPHVFHQEEEAYRAIQRFLARHLLPPASV